MPQARKLAVERRLQLSALKNPSVQLAVAGEMIAAAVEDAVLLISKDLEIVRRHRIGEELLSIGADASHIVTTTRRCSHILSVVPGHVVESASIPWGDPLGRPCMFDGMPWVSVHNEPDGVSLTALDLRTGCSHRIVALAEDWMGGSIDLMSCGNRVIIASPIDARMGVCETSAASVKPLAQHGYVFGACGTHLVAHTGESVALVDMASGGITHSWKGPDTPIAAVAIDVALLLVGSDDVQSATATDSVHVEIEGRNGRGMWHALRFGSHLLVAFDDRELALCSLA